MFNKRSEYFQKTFSQHAIVQRKQKRCVGVVSVHAICTKHVLLIAEKAASDAVVIDQPWTGTFRAVPFVAAAIRERPAWNCFVVDDYRAKGPMSCQPKSTPWILWR
jgi:hypothetical protein